jgi:hypothetical protein
LPVQISFQTDFRNVGFKRGRGSDYLQ